MVGWRRYKSHFSCYFPVNYDLMVNVIILGAGQEVGRSCTIIDFGGKLVMFDCGLHMGFEDNRRYPFIKDFFSSRSINDLICVVISHFHLDHVGAVPYLTEVLKYTGPVYMTAPTRAVAPILLEDFIRVRDLR